MVAGNTIICTRTREGEWKVDASFRQIYDPYKLDVTLHEGRLYIKGKATNKQFLEQDKDYTFDIVDFNVKVPQDVDQSLPYSTLVTKPTKSTMGGILLTFKLKKADLADAPAKAT
mmetsp:Transcript_11305/g.27958  ORF Transcript_11305/g.27958 Transcript_11305/m.27958 type:complete len:115 (-) Transcript_11305:132-476(-)